MGIFAGLRPLSFLPALQLSLESLPKEGEIVLKVKAIETNKVVAGLLHEYTYATPTRKQPP